MKKQPRNFLIARPKVGSAVMVYGISKHPFKAVVFGMSCEPRMVNVIALSDRSEHKVDYGQLTHAAV